jgi:hypothetical protein
MKTGHYFRQTLLITLLNPKAIVFYLAFFPLFIDPAYHQGLLTFGVMALTIAALTFLYGLGAVLLTHFLAERVRANSSFFLTIQSHTSHTKFAHAGHRFALATRRQPYSTAGIVGASGRREKRHRPRRLVRRSPQATNRTKTHPFCSAPTNAGDPDAAEPRKTTATLTSVIGIAAGPGRRELAEG